MKFSIPSLTDARGGQSKTLFFVAVAFFAILLKFLLAGLTIPHLGQVPAMSAQDFGIAIFGTVLPWIGREWKQKSLEAQAAGGAPSDV